MKSQTKVSSGVDTSRVTHVDETMRGINVTTDIELSTQAIMGGSQHEEWRVSDEGSEDNLQQMV